SGKISASCCDQDSGTVQRCLSPYDDSWRESEVDRSQNVGARVRGNAAGEWRGCPLELGDLSEHWRSIDAAKRRVFPDAAKCPTRIPFAFPHHICCGD